MNKILKPLISSLFKGFFILVLGTVFVMPIKAKQKMTVRNVFPDGTPITEWFLQSEVVDYESLGKIYDVRDFDIVSDPSTVQTAKIQAVIDKAAAEGGGVIYLPEGIYKSGALYFKQGTHFYLAKGATLLGSENIQDFPLCITRIEGETCKYFSALVNADNIDGFTISGQGAIDGNGISYWKAFHSRLAWNRKATNKDEMRPRLLYLSNCRNVQIANVNLQNSPYWTSHYYRCENVKILNVRFYAPSKPVSSPSTDGIDMDVCKNFLIKGCRFTVNDDAVCFKGGKGPYAEKDSTNGVVENVLVENCLFDHTSNSAVTCGSEAIHVRNILIRNCKVNGAREFFRLKMRLDTPQLYEQIAIENITGFCKTFFFVHVWKQFFDLKGRKDVPKSYGDNIHLSGIDMKCDIFMRAKKDDRAFELSNFLFKDMKIEAKNAQWDRDIFKSITLKNVVVNGESQL